MRSSTSVIWRVECLAGALHSQLWLCWPSRRALSSADAQRLSGAGGTAARIAWAVAASSSVSATATRLRMTRSCTMSSRCSYNQCRAYSSSPLAISAVGHFIAGTRATLGAGARSSSKAQRLAGLLLVIERGSPRAYSATSDARSGVVIHLAQVTRNTGGTARHCSTVGHSCARNRCAVPGPALWLSPRRRAISSNSAA